MTGLDKQQKLALIRENLAEVLNLEIIEKILAEGKSPKIYWVRSQCMDINEAFC